MKTEILSRDRSTYREVAVSTPLPVPYFHQFSCSFGFGRRGAHGERGRIRTRTGGRVRSRRRRCNERFSRDLPLGFPGDGLDIIPSLLSSVPLGEPRCSRACQPYDPIRPFLNIRDESNKRETTTGTYHPSGRTGGDDEGPAASGLITLEDCGLIVAFYR